MLEELSYWVLAFVVGLTLRRQLKYTEQYSQYDEQYQSLEAQCQNLLHQVARAHNYKNPSLYDFAKFSPEVTLSSAPSVNDQAPVYCDIKRKINSKIVSPFSPKKYADLTASSIEDASTISATFPSKALCNFELSVPKQTIAFTLLSTNWYNSV